MDDLTEAEREWVTKRLAEKPPLGPRTRAKLEQLLSFPPHRDDVVRVEVRAAR